MRVLTDSTGNLLATVDWYRPGERAEFDDKTKHKYFIQESGTKACGLLCVMMAKERVVGRKLTMPELGTHYFRRANRDRGRDDLQLLLTGAAPMVKYEYAEGAAIPDLVLRCTRSSPCILNIQFAGQGILGSAGHFILCVGKSEADPSRFVALDPVNGKELIDVRTGADIVYKPEGDGQNNLYHGPCTFALLCSKLN
jgi:hypothetical protein